MEMTDKLFETALGIGSPWYVAGADFDAQAKTPTIRVDCTAGSRFATRGVADAHPVHDTVAKRCRHPNFFQHECFLQVWVPPVRTARAGVYKERLREILERKQINVVRAMLQHWCTCVVSPRSSR